MNGQKVLIGLSGGINSMAVLCWLHEQKIQPSELHLYYAHFIEHSPDTFQFVADGIRFARKHFQNVKVTITKNSIIDFFERNKLIPHPKNGICSRLLKIEPIEKYCFENEIKIDLVGYVKHELKRRAGKAAKYIDPQISLFGNLEKFYPIGEFTDEWCFEICDKYIGWHPAIYDILDENGNRVFNHNNCLPCKNMTVDQMKDVEKYYISYHIRAMQLSAKLGSYYGRDSDKFYTAFGKSEWETSGESCETCRF